MEEPASTTLNTRRNVPVVRPGGPSAGSARVVVPGQDAGRPGQAGAIAPKTNTIMVNPCQKGMVYKQGGWMTEVRELIFHEGNPIISYMKNVAWEYGDILSDYQVGATSGVLYLSLRYHRLHPEYVHGRISKLGSAYLLRVLLVSVDVDDHQEVLKELTKVAVVNNLTMMLAWSSQEAGRYLEIYKNFERKPPDLIKERRENDYMSHMNAVLTNIRGVNRTDVVTLTSNFGSLANIANAGAEELLACPGLGEKKVKRLREAFTAPFVVKKRKSNAEKRGALGNELN